MMTKSEYLANLKKKSDRVESYSSKKGNKKHAIILLILLLGTVLSITLGIADTEAGRKKAYNTYIEDHKSIDYEQLSYRDTFSVWNTKDIGNDVNALLSGGKVYSREDISVIPDLEGIYNVYQNSEPVARIESSISYINVVDDVLFYREDRSRSLMAYRIGTEQSVTLVETDVGEVFVTENQIYYINLKNSALMKADLDGNNKRIVYDHPINTFAVCGKSVFMLDNNARFGVYHISEDGSGVFSSIADNVERFFIAGNVYAESGNTVFTFNPNGGKAESIYQTDNASMRLIGVSDSTLFVQESGKLYGLHNGNKTTIISDSYELYQSIIPVENGKYYVVATTDPHNALASNELLTFEMK